MGWLENGRATERGKGEPDFRCIYPGAPKVAVQHDLCWLCGQKLGQYKAFVIGPMCAVNRTTSEPPCHLDCARFAAMACPFLTNPRMRRNEHDMPMGHTPGIAIDRNPGATCIWVTKSYRVVRVHNGSLIRLGEPTSVLWFAKGAAATRAEVQHSIDTGYPILEKIAIEDGPSAVAALHGAVTQARRYLPTS